MINPFRRDVITITRPDSLNSQIDAGYIGETKADETVVVANLPADIQHKDSSGSPKAKLPGDVARGTFPEVFFTMPQGSILKNDIITDQNGIRYQIAEPYWTVFGYQCYCERLQN
jgi:hypothetical protein